MHIRNLGFLFVSLYAIGCGSPPATKAPAAQPAGTGATSDDTAMVASTSDSSAPAAAQASPALPRPTDNTQALEKRACELSFDLQLMKNGSPAGMQSGSWSISEERTEAVRGVSGDAITKLEMIYGRRVAKPLLGLEQPSYTENKTYLVTGSGGTPSVTRGAKPAPDKERDAVLYEYGWVGAPSPLVGMMRGAKPGGTLEPTEDGRRALLGDVPGIDEAAMDVKAVFKGATGGAHPAAQFDVTARGPLKSGDMTFNLDLAGPAKIDMATGWVTQLSLSGKVKVKGKVKFKKKKLDAEGHGTMTITRDATFH